MQSTITLSRSVYRDKVLGCWLGKNIGGTLGAPYEGQQRVLSLTFFDPIPVAAAQNDDLDLQLVWLQMLEEVGLDPALPHFADYWARHASAYPWDEYGYFMRNHARGLRPPIAGCFENFFVDNMGSPIRSEIWACLYPGDPDSAARLAWKDSAVDHAGGEGTYGEMFWAALEAAAFVTSNTETLIRVGLNAIPISSQISRVIREAVRCHQTGLDWDQARARIVEWFGTRHPCHAVPNHGFTILGWLYGRDFGDKLCKAVNCGFDTDCTGATLGSVLGIIHGAAAVPPEWRRPVGDRIMLHPFTRFLNAPADVNELTDRIIALAEKAATPERRFGATTQLPPDLTTRLFVSDKARAALTQDNHMGVELLLGHTVELHYGGEPVLWPAVARTVELTVDGKPCADTTLTGPPGVTVNRLGANRFSILAESPPAQSSLLAHVPGLGKVAFVILGPTEVSQKPPGTSVPKCGNCGARVEDCACVSEFRDFSNIRFIREWNMIGPFPSQSPGRITLDQPTPVELESHFSAGQLPDLKRQFSVAGKTLSWKPVTASPLGFVDLGDAVGFQQWCSALAVATVTAEKDHEATLLCSSDDSVRVWLNGQQIHTLETDRAASQFALDKIRIQLHKGSNTLIFRVDNHQGGWGLLAGIRRG